MGKVGRGGGGGVGIVTPQAPASLALHAYPLACAMFPQVVRLGHASMHPDLDLDLTSSALVQASPACYADPALPPRSHAGGGRGQPAISLGRGVISPSPSVTTAAGDQIIFPELVFNYTFASHCIITNKRFSHDSISNVFLTAQYIIIIYCLLYSHCTLEYNY